MREFDRREFLKLSAGLAGLLLARPRLSAAIEPIPGDRFGISRASKLFPGRFVVHSDLHNHTFFSGDAVGDPESAFAEMFANGLDVAALTDHAIMGHTIPCPHQSPCSPFMGMNDEGWQRAAMLADAANREGTFVAIRGFEWTTGTLGHLNVWFTREWTDPIRTRGLITQRGLSDFFDQFPPNPVGETVSPIADASPEVLASMEGLYEWLGAEPDRPVLGGGADGIAGFNHPNYYGDFNGYQFDDALVPRMVTCEALNVMGGDDYLFARESPDQREPISALLGAGWKLGLIGVSDEHGDYRTAVVKPRGGLWVSELTRAGVREALLARRTFATHEAGLRLDASANGVPMGRPLAHASGPVTFRLDIAKAGWAGRELQVQVIVPATEGVAVAHAETITMSADDPPPFSLSVPLNATDAPWVFLRISDPDRPRDAHLAGTPVASFGGAVVYSSPWYLSSPA